MEAAEGQPSSSAKVELLDEGILKMRITGTLEERRAFVAQAALDVATRQLTADIQNDAEGLADAIAYARRNVSEAFFPPVFDPEDIDPDERAQLDRVEKFLNGKGDNITINPIELRVYADRVKKPEGVVPDTIDVHFSFNSRDQIKVEPDWLTLGRFNQNKN